jgi:hypothetical protein
LSSIHSYLYFVIWFGLVSLFYYLVWFGLPVYFGSFGFNGFALVWFIWFGLVFGHFGHLAWLGLSVWVWFQHLVLVWFGLLGLLGRFWSFGLVWLLVWFGLVWFGLVWFVWSVWFGLVSIWFGLAWVLVWVWFQFGLPGLAWFG